MNSLQMKSRLAIAALLLSGPSAFAEPIIEAGDRAEINWSTLEVRYFGEAAPEAAEKDSFKGTERRAWQDGIAAIEETLQLLGKGRIGMHVSAPRGAANSGGSRATSRSTTYFGDGKVRVYLQSPLQQVVTAALGEVSFRPSPQRSPAEEGSVYSGVVIELSSKTSPLAIYKLTDAAGTKLFGVEDMTESGFTSNLMGRWFRRAAASEIARHAGDNPLIIKAKHTPDSNRIVVDREMWEGNGAEISSLIASGRVVVSTL